MKNVLMLALLVPVIAFGADAAPAALGWMDTVIQFVKDLGAGPTMVIITGAVEFVFRMIKTQEPLSIAHLIAAGLKKCAEMMSAVADFLDKILPQRLS